MKLSSIIIPAVLTLPFLATADEGMYTFDNPPAEVLKQRYGFTPAKEWFDDVMKSAVRFNNGGSGSFVSADGLVMTNHHVGFDCIQKISTKENDFVLSGYIAATSEMEVRCPDLELNVLVGLEDVTGKMTAASKDTKNDADAEKARKKQAAALEKECHDKTGLRCDVVTLYGGGQYVMYTYRKHTDVRLVFAPEQQMAFFGGDPDNFTYPRYDLDVAFFRVYEDGKPYKPSNYFKWSKAGAADNELIFVAGNPGSTGRMSTVAQLDFERKALAIRIDSMQRMLETFRKYAASGPENLRQVKEQIFGYENSYKALKWTLDELNNPVLIGHKARDEKAFIDASKNISGTADEVGNAIAKIAEAQEVAKKIYPERYYSAAVVGRSELLARAFMIAQLIEEKRKPNEDRFEEYRDSALPSLELQIYSGAPIYSNLEETVLLNSFSEAQEKLGKNDRFIEALSADGDARAILKEAVAKTKLFDPAYRRQIVIGAEKAGPAGFDQWKISVDDPMMKLAFRIEPILRKLRKNYEEKVQSVERSQSKRLQEARYAIHGKGLPPDATFTPRISFGVVKGYEAEGTLVPYKTTFYGLFARNADFDGKPPFDLPGRWKEAARTLNLSTPINFVSTADIVGGNSGSPVINKNREIVGIVFDGNIEGFVLRYFYNDKSARCVSVHSSGIIEALEKVYAFDRLANELIGMPKQ